MKKYHGVMLYSIFTVLFGLLMFVYGGYDDSPGAQLLGLLLFIFGIASLIKNKK